MPSAHPGRAASFSRRGMLRGAASLAVLGPALTTLGSPAAGAATAPASPPTTGLRGVALRALVNTPHLSMYKTFLAPAWEKMTGGTLDVTAVDYTQLTDRIIDDVRNGTGEFDVFDYYYYGLGAIADAGALVDLTDWAAAQQDLDIQDFLRSVHAPYSFYKGRQYGLPYDGDQHLVFYNQELLDTYRLKPPTTWNEYDAIARKITQGGGGRYYGAVVQGQPHPMVLGCAFINRLVGYGGDLVDRSGKPTLTSAAAVAAAQHLIDISPYALPTPTETGFDAATDAYLAGRTALIESWTGVARRADDPALSKIVGKWGAVALPLGGGNRRRRTPLNGGYGLGVSTASRNREAALAFIKWVTSADEMLLETSRKNSAIDPNRTSVLHSGAYARTTPDTVDLIRAGLDGPPMVWPKGPADPGNLQHLVDQLALAIEGEQSAATALRNARTAWN